MYEERGNLVLVFKSWENNIWNYRFSASIKFIEKYWSN